jgi:hypothetical protein
MDFFTALCALERKYGTDAARELLARAASETSVPLSRTAWLDCYPSKTGERRFDLVGVSR